MSKLTDNYSTTSTNISVENYDFKVREKILYLKENILNRITLKKDAVILDIGCGWGGSLSAFRDCGYDNLYGFDQSKEQIDYAKTQGKLENVIVSDALEYLKSTTQTFDLITMFDVLEHLENDYAVELLGLINQRLNSGGQLVIQVPNGITLIQAYLFSDITHIRSYTSLSLAQVFKSTGFYDYNFFESSLVAITLKQKIAKICLNLIFKPLTMFYILSLTGSKFGSIYTANIIAITTKN
ncbi:MAG: class I SAM-dependent methyltransferase [Candidatus Parcubacteria bacterium]|nr:class I SAM-dependent methyltransferase [Candidatus Paceibacterota bacterium]